MRYASGAIQPQERRKAIRPLRPLRFGVRQRSSSADLSELRMIHQAIHKPGSEQRTDQPKASASSARPSGRPTQRRSDGTPQSGHNFADVAVHRPDHRPAAHVQPQAPSNETGLPDALKAGVEQLAGISLDDVRVHYNSAKPAQLDALAFTQGHDIHVAPGQEQHLAHEAWHVVQQAQGRVQPTMQMKDAVPANDDRGLEHQADVMGAKAAVIGHLAVPSRLFQGRAEQTEAHPQREPIGGKGEQGPLNDLSSPIQCKKVIRNGQIVDEPEPQPPPVFPGPGHRLGDQLNAMPPVPELPQHPPIDRSHLFPGRGNPLGSDSVTTPGRLMVSRSVASSIFSNHVSGLPPLRPEMGKVGGVTWTVTSKETPHTGIDQPQTGEESKDVPIGVNINAPRLREGAVSPNPRIAPVGAGNHPFTTVVSTNDLEGRFQASENYLKTDPEEREQARQLGVKRKKAEIFARFEKEEFNDAEKKRISQAEKTGNSKEAAIAKMKDQYIREAETTIPSSVSHPPPARVEQAMWRNVGRDISGSSSGLGRVELRGSRFSRRANGDFTLIGPQARHLVTLDEPTALRAQEQTAHDRTEEAKRVRQSVYDNYAEIRETLRKAEMDRRQRQQNQ